MHHFAATAIVPALLQSHPFSGPFGTVLNAGDYKVYWAHINITIVLRITSLVPSLARRDDMFFCCQNIHITPPLLAKEGSGEVTLASDR